LARAITFQFITAVEYEMTDVYADALLGLMRAAQYYVPELGKFSTYAYRVVQNTVMGGYRNRKGPQKRVLSYSDHPCHELADYRTNATVEGRRTAERELLTQRLLASLPERMQTLLYLRYFEGLTLREVGEKMSLSKGRIKQLRDQAIQEIRDNHPDLIQEGLCYDY